MLSNCEEVNILFLSVQLWSAISYEFYETVLSSHDVEIWQVTAWKSGKNYIYTEFFRNMSSKSFQYFLIPLQINCRQVSFKIHRKFINTNIYAANKKVNLAEYCFILRIFRWFKMKSAWRKVYENLRICNWTYPMQNKH